MHLTGGLVRLVVTGIIATGLLAGIQAAAVAESVLGCPYGLDKGDWWIRAQHTNTEHKERYNAKTNEMEDLGAGESSEKAVTRYRLGYGLSERVDVGVSLIYEDRSAHLKTEKGWNDINASGLADVWLAAKYKIQEDYTPDAFWKESHVCLGLGVKLPQSSNSEVTQSIGNGADAVRLGVLGHYCHDDFDICGHVTYTFVGDAPTVAGWKKSGWDLPGRISYKLFVEYDLADEFALTTGPIGWMDRDMARGANGTSGYHARSHNWAFNLAWHPNGVEIEHQKLMAGVTIPYSVKSGLAPDYSWMVGGMWTW